MEPCPLNERTAKVLGLPLRAVTPTARLMANRTEWLWFDPALDLAIWQGPDARQGFPAHTLRHWHGWVGGWWGRFGVTRS